MSEKLRTHNGYTYLNFLDYDDKVRVGSDDYTTGMDKVIIGTEGVCVCLAITLYDSQHKLGSLAHISGFRSAPFSIKPENIVETMLRDFLAPEYLNYGNLEATLSGEGIIIGSGPRNSDIVRRELEKHSIPIVGEDLTAAHGRLVFLDCDTGTVDVFRSA